MNYVAIPKDHPDLWIPKTKFGTWLYIYLSYLGFVLQLVVVGLNVWFYFMLESQANLAIGICFLGLAVLQFVSGRKRAKARRERIKTVKGILARHEALAYTRNGHVTTTGV